MRRALIRPTVAGVLLAALSTGCAEEFDSRTLLTGYRVLGIAAEPPEAGPEARVRVTVADVNVAGATYRWSLCFFDLGALTGYRCADPALDVVLAGDGPSIVVDYGPMGLDLRALYDAYGPFPGADGRLRTFEDGIDLLLKLESGPPGGRRITTVKTLVVREGRPPNLNPVITGLTLDGDAGMTTAAPGDKVVLAVTLSADSVQTCDDAYRGERTESPVFTGTRPRGRWIPRSRSGSFAGRR